MARETRLEEFMRRLRITPMEVFAEAKKIARRLGLAPFSRQTLYRLRQGRTATDEMILLVVAVMRSLTGAPVRAADLFDLEPALPDLAWADLMGHPDPSRSSTRQLSVFSMPHRSNVWRQSVAEEPLTPTEALELLYERHAAFLRATAKHRYQIPPQDVDELVHDIFTSFLVRQPRVDDERAYLLGALRNSVSYYRRRRPHETALLPEHEETEDRASTQREEQWALRISLGATLARMGEKCRETLRRYYLLEESTEHIAKELKTTPGNVFQLLHACRKRARDIYIKLTSAPP